MNKRLLVVVVVLGAAAALVLGRSLMRNRPAFVPHSFRLPNGLNGEVVPGECGPKAALVVTLTVGANQDPAGQSGMTRVVERLLATPGDQSRVVKASADHTVYSVVSPREKILDEVDAFAKRLAQPQLTEAAVAEAKQQVLADIAKRAGTDATLTALTDASESVLPSAGRGRRGGIAAEIEKIDLAAVNAFWQAHLTPGNARVLVLGDVDQEKARARIEQAFGKQPGGTIPTPRAPGDMTVTGTLVMGDAPTAVAIAVRAPAIKDASYPAFLLLAARLMKEAPGAGEWSAMYDPLTQPELLLVTGPVKTGEPPEPAAARIRSSVDKLLAKPLAPTDVAAARETFGLFLGQHDTDAAVCTKDPQALALALSRRSQLGLKDVNLAQSLEAVTPAQLTEGVALFDSTRAAAVIAGGVNR